MDQINELINFLRDIGLDVERIRISNGNIQMSCPFASVNKLHKNGTDFNPSFGIKIDREKGFVYNCFTCGIKGHSLFQFIQELNNYNLINVDLNNVIKLQNKFLLDILNNKQFNVKNNNTYYNLIGNFDYDISFIDYNIERGVRIDIIKKLGIRYQKSSKKIIFPIYTIDNKYKGYIEKSLVNNFNISKYINRINDSNFLYLEQFINSTVGIVVEGVYDAIVTYQHLFDLKLLNEYSVVATLGANVSSKRLDRLVDFFDFIIIYSDNDIAGYNMSKIINNKLSDKVLMINKIIYNEKDPAEVSLEKFNKYIKNIRPYKLIQ